MADTDLKDPNVALPMKLVGAGASGATDNFADVDLFGNLKTMIPTKLVGEVFEGSTLDPDVWSSTLVGSGTLAQGSGLLTFQTGTTANSSVFLASLRKGRYFAETINASIMSVRLGDTGTTNNTRRWGAYDANNGVYFQISGTTFAVGIRSAAVDTIITSFNGIVSPTIDTNFHRYEIQYSHGRAAFFQDGNLIHTYVATTTALAATANFLIGAENTNSGGSTTNVSFYVRDASIFRYGQANARERFFHSNFIGRVQSGNGTSSGNVNSFSITLPSSSTAGNCLIAAVSVSGAAISSITDNKSQTWTQATSLSDGSSGFTYIYYVPNTMSGVTTITVTLGTLVTSAIAIIGVEYFGVNTSSPLDKTSTATNTNTTTLTSGSTTATAQANELLFGSHYTIQSAADAITPGSGWSSIATTGGNGDQLYAQDQVVTATGTYASTGTAAAAHNFYSSIATFKMTFPANAVLTNFPQVIKTGAGTLRRLLVNAPGSGGANIIFYDSTSASGTIIAEVSLTQTGLQNLEFDLDFDNGLTIVVNSTTPDFTIAYD